MLPPTIQQIYQENSMTKEKKINSFFGSTEKFDNNTLNKIITLWQIQNALPWSRVEDIQLQAAFNYFQPGATLFK